MTRGAGSKRFLYLHNNITVPLIAEQKSWCDAHTLCAVHAQTAFEKLLPQNVLKRRVKKKNSFEVVFWFPLRGNSY